MRLEVRGMFLSDLYWLKKCNLFDYIAGLLQLYDVYGHVKVGNSQQYLSFVTYNRVFRF